MSYQPLQNAVPQTYNNDRSVIIVLSSVIAVLMGYLGNIVIAVAYPSMLQSIIPQNLSIAFALLIILVFFIAFYFQHVQDNIPLYKSFWSNVLWLLLGFSIGVLQNVGTAGFHTIAAGIGIKGNVTDIAILILLLPIALIAAFRRTASDKIYLTMYIGFAVNPLLNLIDPRLLQNVVVILLILLTFPLVFFLQLWQQSVQYHKPSSWPFHLLVGIWYGFVSGLLLNFDTNWLLSDTSSVGLLLYKAALCAFTILVLYAPLAIRYASRNLTHTFVAMLIGYCFSLLTVLVYAYVIGQTASDPGGSLFHLQNRAPDVVLFTICVWVSPFIIYYLTGTIIIYCSGRRFREEVIIRYGIASAIADIAINVGIVLAYHMSSYRTPYDYYSRADWIIQIPLYLLSHFVLFAIMRWGAIDAAYERFLFKPLHFLMDFLCSTNTPASAPSSGTSNVPRQYGSAGTYSGSSYTGSTPSSYDPYGGFHYIDSTPSRYGSAGIYGTHNAGNDYAFEINRRKRVSRKILLWIFILFIICVFISFIASWL